MAEPDRNSTIACHACGAQVQFALFPALSKPLHAHAGDATVFSDEATCFFHESKRAVADCESCGRFVCGLCRLDWGNRILCPACISTPDTKHLLVTSRTLYGNIALAVAAFSVLVFYVSLLIAPVALAIAIKSFRSEGSLVRPGRWTAWLAIIVASAELIGWTWLITYFVLKFRT